MLTFKDFMAYSLNLETKSIANKWLHPVTSNEYREGLLYIYENIFQYHCRCWLYDASQFTSPSIRDQKWTMEVFAALLSKSTLKKIAILLPESELLRVFAEDVDGKAIPIFGDGVELKYFFNSEEANDWIQLEPTNTDAGNQFWLHR